MSEDNPSPPFCRRSSSPGTTHWPIPAVQEKVLQQLLGIYAKTEYGQQHGAERVGSLADYRAAFPVQTYADYLPILRRVMAGDTHALLEAEPLGWAMTRGTTGSSKYIPMTPRDLEQRHNAARAVIQYVLTSKRWEILQGANLNLSFPSVVGSMEVEGRTIEYGYATGIYVKHVAARMPVPSIPKQEGSTRSAATSANRTGKRASGWRMSAPTTRTSPFSAARPRSCSSLGAGCAKITASTRRTCGNSAS